MIYPKAEIRGMKKTVGFIKAEKLRRKKAMETAIKVEAFRLRNLLKKEIRQGRPGRVQMAPLSYVASSKLGLAAKYASAGALNRKRNRNRPLAQLHHGVHYDVTRDKSNPFMAYVGFGQPSSRGSWAQRHTGDNLAFSRSWMRLAAKHQEGFTADIDKGDRRWYAYKGGKLGKKTRTRKYYFIRKDRHSFQTPARPIIKPFLQAYRSEALRNIGMNFRRKLRGDRI